MRICLQYHSRCGLRRLSLGTWLASASCGYRIGLTGYPHSRAIPLPKLALFGEGSELEVRADPVSPPMWAENPTMWVRVGDCGSTHRFMGRGLLGLTDPNDTWSCMRSRRLNYRPKGDYGVGRDRREGDAASGNQLDGFTMVQVQGIPHWAYCSRCGKGVQDDASKVWHKIHMTSIDTSR